MPEPEATPRQVTNDMSMAAPNRNRRSRREYLRDLVAVGGTVALTACLQETDPTVPTGDPAERPHRQHAWNDVLRTDEHGNRRPPKHHVLVPLRLVVTPTEEPRTQVETALQSLESAYAFDPEGLLFTVGYAPAYFERIGAELPIPSPEPLTPMESPTLDAFDALVHLASDAPSVVLEAEEALLGSVDEPNGVSMDATLEGVFERAEPRRTGFVGPGLPAAHTDVDGVPDSVPEDAPFFMGFRSGLAESQASEDRVTIEEGPYAGGTTTHVESLSLQLETWFEQEGRAQRVARTFSPEHDPESIGDIGEGLGASTGVVGDIAEKTAEHARTRGVVGHAQKAARARDEDGAPLLLRRDFNTVDGDRPGAHFLAHQRRIEEYIRVRQAMAGLDLAGEGVGQRHNNGLLQYIFVRRRGNYLIPPRDRRALPNTHR